MDKYLSNRRNLVLKQLHFIIYSLVMIIVASFQVSLGYGLYGIYQLAVAGICCLTGIITVPMSNKIVNKKKYFLLSNIGLWVEIFLFYVVGSFIKEFSTHSETIGKINPKVEFSLFIIAFVFAIITILYEIILQRKINKILKTADRVE